ncbi:MAG: hypothetical protein ACOCQG_03005 [Candidatus Nanoarchaeia archaeon]
MAKAKAKKSSKETLKWKKKKWVKIVAPKEFKSASLGESLVMAPENLVGRTVESNLMTITGDMKKQNINVKFSINGIKDGQAVTELRSYGVIPSAVKRMVRRTRDRIDQSFIVETKDGFKMRVKPILITASNTSNSVLNMLRKKTEDLITKHLSKTNKEDLVTEILNHKLQNELKKLLKNVYPLRVCEIRKIEVLKTPEENKNEA